MHNLVSVQKKETHKLLSGIGIQTDYLISAKRPVINKKRTCKIVDFAVHADQRKKKLKESEKKDNYLDLAKELKIYRT